eukprot:symbB.v1.2.025237.t1/scaffold2370.1/size80994/5
MCASHLLPFSSTRSFLLSRSAWGNAVVLPLLQLQVGQRGDLDSRFVIGTLCVLSLQRLWQIRCCQSRESLARCLPCRWGRCQH